jgi:methyl-accepting chemotaxis protein
MGDLWWNIYKRYFFDMPYTQKMLIGFLILSMGPLFTYAAGVYSLGWTIRTLPLFIIMNFFAVYLASRVFTNNLIRPLLQLAKRAEDMDAEDFTEVLTVEAGRDEVGQFVNAFNRMRDNLKGLVAHASATANSVASTSQEVAASTEEMNATTEEVSATIQHIANEVHKQKMELAKASEEINNIFDMLDMVNNTNLELTAITSKTNERAEKGGDAAKVAVKGMAEANRIAHDSARVVTELGEQSNQISEIVDVITNIADQTNLLALNAAIEAARAGEHGRGFAVVAEEVRKLAESSAKAGEEVSNLVKAIQEETTRAVDTLNHGAKSISKSSEVVNEALTALYEIGKDVKVVTENIHGITNATAQQAAMAENVMKALEKITTSAGEAAGSAEQAAASTQVQTASMEQLNASAQELAEQANNLQEAVERFKIKD